MIQAPIPPTSNDLKAVPWEYNLVYIHGKRYECPPVGEQNVPNIAGTSNMTRSGRIYGVEPSKKTDLIPTKDKRTTVVDTNQEIESPNKDFIDQEAEEFLKIIKKSDYRVVDQLH